MPSFRRVRIFLSIAVRLTSLLLLAACSSTVPAPELPRAGDACEQVPEPHRWTDAGVPDVGGVLFLGINDDHVADNSGEFRVQITRSGGGIRR